MDYKSNMLANKGINCLILNALQLINLNTLIYPNKY